MLTLILVACSAFVLLVVAAGRLDHFDEEENAWAEAVVEDTRTATVPDVRVGTNDPDLERDVAIGILRQCS